MKLKRSNSLKHRFSSPAAAERRAFTMVELLVILAVLALMVCVLATACAASQSNAQGALCLNNLKQMMAAFTMYSHDNSDLFPPNYDSPSCSWAGDIVAGGMPYNTPAQPDAGNPDILKDPKLSPLTPYIRTNLSLYRCPFDPRVCPYSGSDPTMFGQKIPIVRSISINGGVGTKGSCGGATTPVDGPWLNGSHSHTANNPYATFGKWSDFKIVRPSDIWVFVDDDPWTINDAGMQVIASAPDTIDYVNSLNNNSTCFSFADGRVETHKWKSSIWLHNAPPSRTDFVSKAVTGLGYTDWFWWASHATRSTITGSVGP